MVRPPLPPPIERQSADSEPMWSLDLAIAALAGLVLYLITSRLRFDDPRWLFNGWTYAVAVPAIAITLAVLSHGIVTRYVGKAIQLGFLFSVLVHLLLLILAVHVIILSHYFPDAFSGVEPQRSPISRTVPEYLFETPKETPAIPDWSQPLEVETTSRIVPEEPRQLPPVAHSEPKLELPEPTDPPQPTVPKHLMKRDQPTESLPQPTDAPAKLARRRNSESPPQLTSQVPTAPDVPDRSEVELQQPEREIVAPPRTRSSASVWSSTAAAPADTTPPSEPEPSLAGARNLSRNLPMVGQSGLQRQSRMTSPLQQPAAAGAAPAPSAVPVARLEEAAERMLAPADLPITRQGRTTGVQLSIGQAATTGLPTSPQTSGSSELARDRLAAPSGLPSVTAGRSQRAPGRTQWQTLGSGLEPAGTPVPLAVATDVASPSDSLDGQTAEDLLDRNAEIGNPARQSSESSSPALSAAATAPALDLLVEAGPAGLSQLPDGRAGVVPSDNQPQIVPLDLSRGPRPRRDVGGPMTPQGTKVASVESFNRRIMRTRGGAAPMPAGLVGPDTEEAIERGLAYLASTQNDDGSWSLQGHGSDVLLRSDTAATGLCLLAFQGAGYTHRQHQYAGTVSRGLKFLLDHQRTNGDLYRVEDSLSDRNVAFYSHGIAALALCEAYGMTQDPELRDAAQACLNYMTDTQHRERGGWRYTPQVSADTSVTGWMMMALKSGQLSGLEVSQQTYKGIENWLAIAQSPERPDRYRYNPFAPDTPTQRHGRVPTPTMTSVGMLMRMYSGWRRDYPAMQSAAEYLLTYPPQMGTARSPQRDAYYWYYATQVMFHMGGDHWQQWNRALNPLLLSSQIKEGVHAGSWDPLLPVPDRWSTHAGRLYVTTMNLLNLEVYYRHLPIYEETAE